MEKHPDVDTYLQHSELWPKEIAALRPTLRGAGLDEHVKWGKPCYTVDDKNIVILQEMKNFLSIMFFKGALLSDPDQVLSEQGPNSRSAKRIEVTSVAEVKQLAPTIQAYVAEAIDVEAQGLEVPEAPAPELADALQERLERDPAFRKGFESLTPGRQREYNLHVSGAKQATTRASRVEKVAPRILSGKGLRDR